MARIGPHGGALARPDRVASQHPAAVCATFGHSRRTLVVYRNFRAGALRGDDGQDAIETVGRQMKCDRLCHGVPVAHPLPRHVLNARMYTAQVSVLVVPRPLSTSAL